MSFVRKRGRGEHGPGPPATGDPAELPTRGEAIAASGERKRSTPVRSSRAARHTRDEIERGAPSARSVSVRNGTRSEASRSYGFSWADGPIGVHLLDAAGGQIRDRSSVRRRSLALGEAFETKVARALEAIAGTPITRSSLLDLYSACLPDTRVRLTASVEKGVFAYTVSWIDNVGEVVSTLRRKLMRHEDGVLELYSHGCWVEPRYRGRAISTKIFLRELLLLRTLSSHPDTRLSLWAGGMANPKRRAEIETVGVYAWAGFGFEFACEHHLKTALGMNTDRPRAEADKEERRGWSDLELMRRQFRGYLDEISRIPSLEGRTRRACEVLRSSSQRFVHPWEFARAKLPRVRIGGDGGLSDRGHEVGKAFLLSAQAPRWEGVFFVNRTRAPGARIAAAYARRSLASSGRTLMEQDAALEGGLASADPEIRLRAIEQIGVSGGRCWIDRLVELRTEHPEHEEAIDLAILRVEGKWKPPQPSFVSVSDLTGALTAYRPTEEHRALEALDQDALLEQVRGGNARKGLIALEVLADRNKTEDPVLVRGEAQRYFGAHDLEEEWSLRRGAVEVLGRMRDEAGVPALIEIAQAEQDINVLIAIEKYLERAETPIAEALLLELGLRVKAMKEEIERALRELSSDSPPS